MLPRHKLDDETKLQCLRHEVRLGIDALERDDYVEVNDSELEGYFQALLDHEAHRRKRKTNGVAPSP